MLQVNVKKRKHYVDILRVFTCLFKILLDLSQKTKKDLQDPTRPTGRVPNSEALPYVCYNLVVKGSYACNVKCEI